MSWLRAVRYGAMNIVRWFPVIWRDRDWDHAFLFELMAVKFAHMEAMHRRHGNLVRSDQTAHECMVAKNLCRRIADGAPSEIDTFASNPRSRLQDGRLGGARVTEPFWLSDMRIDGEWFEPRQQDVEVLARLMRRKALGWWD